MRRSKPLPNAMFNDDAGTEVLPPQNVVFALSSGTGDRMTLAPTRLVVEDAAPELRLEIARVFGNSFLADPVKVESVVRVARDFRLHGARLLSTAVSMGESLLELRSQVGDEDFARAVRESRMIFCGWSAGNLSKMMAVAAFVSSGHYRLDQLPQNWSTVYELTTLKPAQMERALKGELVRPDVTRAQVVAFKKQLASGPRTNAADGGDDPLTRKLSLLKKRLAMADIRAARQKEARRRLVEDIADVEARIAAAAVG